MNKVVTSMVDNGVCGDGDLSYILYRFCKYNVKPSYRGYKNFLGELRECAEQIERDMMGPYEEEARERNGDVYEDGGE